MFLLDDILTAPGKAMFAIFEEMAKKAQEEFLDDDTVKKELQEIYALVEAGGISEADFEAREHRLLERLEQIARLKFGEHVAVTGASDMPSDVIDVEPADEPPPLRIEAPAERWAPPAPSAPADPVALSGPSAPSAPPEPAAPGPPAPPGPLTMGQVVDAALQGLSRLKLKVSSVTSVMHASDGWRVSVEVLERRSVPDTSDLLGVYELQMDDAGTILRYERTRMRRRCDIGR